MIIDELWIAFVHNLCVYAGFLLNPLFKLISFLGEKAWFFLLISLLLFLGKKTRWIGATAILSIFLGFIVSDFLIKPFVMRLRPYESSKIYQDHWTMAGAIPDTNSSMPSGHTIGCAAFFISIYITCKKNMKKKVFIAGIICTMLMILARTYLMHHYLTDCLVSVILSLLLSFLSKFIVKGVHSFLKSNEDIGLFSFILNFDLYSLFLK